MNIGIFGSTGFIGKNLASFLAIEHTVVCFTRAQLEGNIAGLAEKLAGLDVIINLVGSGIVEKRWTKKYKKEIVDSRVMALSKIKMALALIKGPPPVFISASAVGIYRPGTYNDEINYTYGNDFLSDVVRKWEAAAMDFGELVSKSIILRFGIVLGYNGGALKKLIKLYRRGLGGILGFPEYIYPYISINDLVRAILFLIQKVESIGVYNFVEPVKISNKEFSNALAEALHKRVFFNFPGGLVTLFLGKRAAVLFAGQHVFPAKLLNLGFEFQDHNISEYLNKEVNKK